MTGSPADSAKDPRVGRVSVRVRYGETDRMGVVYHGNHLVYFEIGRTEFLRSRGVAYADLERAGLFLVVTEAQCRYLGRATYDDTLDVETRCERVSRVRVRFGYRIRQASDGSTVAEGYTDLAAVDANGRPRPLPPEVSGPLEEVLFPPSD